MKLLALETSTMMGSIALSNDDTLIMEYQIRINATYSDMFLPLIDQLLNSAHLTIKDVEGFAIAIGPGSFTALRVGISLIKGIALVTDAPIVGIPSLDGLAHNLCLTRNTAICPIIDARKGEVYTAVYKGNDDPLLRKLIPERAIKPAILLNEIEEETIFLGNGVDVYGKMISETLKEKALFAPLHLRYPRASSLIHLSLPYFERGDCLRSENITPLYVRPAEAEIKDKENKTKIC